MLRKTSRVIFHFLLDKYTQFIQPQQIKMAHYQQGLAFLSLLGLLCGVIVGAGIVFFRLFLQYGSNLILPEGDYENFEALPDILRFALCVTGGLIVGLILHLTKTKYRSVGIVHVIERLEYHQSRLPIRNAVIQFFTSTICILTGQSLGREGPSIHLGAASGSQLGKFLQIPHNSVRILIACGVAAAISAAFDTPLAGVIFAMEVIVMEYTVLGFAPVIISAVTASNFSRYFIDSGNSLLAPSLPTIHPSSPEIFIIAIMGAGIGVLAALFIQFTLMASNIWKNKAVWARTTLAGVITGGVGFFIPQVMGTGYDTTNAILLGEITLVLAATLLFAKLICTSCAVGLGSPAGLIGPTLFIGASAGAVYSLCISHIFSTQTDIALFAVIGMAAMMGATLQAPLSALIYLLELTATHSIILPGMAAVITSTLVCRIGFNRSSIYRHLLLIKGMDYRNSALSVALRRVGVASVMDKNFIILNKIIQKEQAQNALSASYQWFFVHDKNHQYSVLPSSDLSRYLVDGNNEEDVIDLMAIPAKRKDTARISILATLQEAHEKMQELNCAVLLVEGVYGKQKNTILGVIHQEHIESCFRSA